MSIVLLKKNILKRHSIREEHSYDNAEYRLPYVAILQTFSKRDSKQYSVTHPVSESTKTKGGICHFTKRQIPSFISREVL